MYYCYVDESGDTAPLYTENKNSMPLFVLGGLILKADKIPAFTKSFVRIKRKYFPDLAKGLEKPIDLIRKEIKGSDLRNPKSLKSKKKWKHTQSFLDEIINLIQTHDGKIISRIYVKKPDESTNAVSIYTSALQYICSEFNHYLSEKSDHGIIIADSRSHQLDVQTSHSIFTQKYKYEGDEHPNVIEMPVFGKSDNHAGIQVSDIICSALLFPFASHVFCHEHSERLRNIHVQPCHEKLRIDFTSRVAHMQYRRPDPKKPGRKTGGVFLSNQLDNKAGYLLLKKPVTMEEKLETLVGKYQKTGSIRLVKGRKIIKH